MRHLSPEIAPMWLHRPLALFAGGQPLQSSPRAQPQPGTLLPVAPKGILQQAGELGVAVGHVHNFLVLVSEGTNDVPQGQLPTQRKAPPPRQIQLLMRIQLSCSQDIRPGARAAVQEVEARGFPCQSQHSPRLPWAVPLSHMHQGAESSPGGFFKLKLADLNLLGTCTLVPSCIPPHSPALSSRAVPSPLVFWIVHIPAYRAR